MEVTNPNKWRNSAIINGLIFIILALSVKLQTTWITGLDSTVQKVLPAGSTAMINSFNAISFFGSPVFVIAAGVALSLYLFIRKERTASIWVFCTLFGGEAVAFICKLVIGRERPAIKLISDTGFSFPSGHTFSTALLMLFLVYILVPRISNQELALLGCLIALIWFIAIAFARIYLRVHYPTDILGSLFLALTWWSFARVLYSKYAEKVGRLVHQEILEK